MQITKQRCMYSGTHVITTNCYAHYWAFFNRLADIAKKDFPGINLDKAEIVCYGGDCHRHMWGFEFKVPISRSAFMHPEYHNIDQLELTL